MSKNLFAYTANSHPYPEYISLNEKPDGELLLTVRGPAKPGPYSDKDCGADATSPLPPEQLEKFILALTNAYREWNAVRRA